MSRMPQRGAAPTQHGARLGDVDVTLVERLVLLHASAEAERDRHPLLARTREDHAAATYEALSLPRAGARAESVYSAVGGTGLRPTGVTPPSLALPNAYRPRT